MTTSEPHPGIAPPSPDAAGAGPSVDHTAQVAPFSPPLPAPPAMPVCAVPLEVVPQPTVGLNAPPRFCSRCGTSWMPGWTLCRVCGPNPQPLSAIYMTRSIGSVGSAIWLYFAFLASSLAGFVAVKNGADLVGVELLLTPAVSLIVLIWAGLESRRTELGISLGRPGWYLLGLLGGVATFALATAAIHGIQRLVDLPEIQMSPPFLAAGHGWTVVILVFCVQPAVIEELAFRGVILSGMRQFLQPAEAVLVSALLFMIIHLAVGSFPHLLIMGLVLGYLRVRSGSLFPGVVLHFVHNLLCVLQERNLLWR